MSKAQIKVQGNHFLEEVDVVNNHIIRNGKSYKVSQLKLDVPIFGTVYGTLLNYKGSLQLMKEQMNMPPYHVPPKAPILYIKPKNTYAAFSEPIPLPGDCPQLEIGASLGIVIGKTATKVSEKNAHEFIKGYTILNDISVPHKSVYRPSIRFKVRDKFCAIGPWIISADSISEPNKLAIRVYINDELVQNNTTSNLVRSIPKLLQDVTDFMTLFPGDVLMIGVPENAALATEGDKIKIVIEGIGFLENAIVSEENLELEEEIK